MSLASHTPGSRMSLGWPERSPAVDSHGELTYLTRASPSRPSGTPALPDCALPGATPHFRYPRRFPYRSRLARRADLALPLTTLVVPEEGLEPPTRGL